MRIGIGWRKAGFTLVEIVVSMAIFGVLLMMAFLVFSMNLVAFDEFSVRADLNQELNLVMDELMRDGRAAEKLVVDPGAKRVTLTDMANIDVSYEIMNDGQIVRKQGGGATAAVTVLSTHADYAASVFKTAGINTFRLDLRLMDVVRGVVVELPSSIEIVKRN